MTRVSLGEWVNRYDRDVPELGTPLEQLGFLTIGLFDSADPGPGHESVLRVIELGERLGYDSAWLRHRHLQFGISSPLSVLAAATQRTSRIELGTAVTPLGWENPLRLAEDLATVDVLSGGRLNPGVSVGEPRNYEHFKNNLYPDSADAEDFTYERVARLLRAIDGQRVSTFSGVEGIETFSERIEPHARGLRSRMWYGGASVQSAQWAGHHELNFLSSSVVRAETIEDETVPAFAAIQRAHIDAFRDAHPEGEKARASQGLVVIPTDRASRSQVTKYQAYVDARTPRTATPQGPSRLMFANDVIGSSEKIAEVLYADAGFRGVREVVFALPFSFDHEDYVQIITDIAEILGPALGWEPKSPHVEH
jgi:alkanesulfonate monooxygenase SsuD/methylene tetrahydromethanopterin reductase-like flavin-dependent oxidoreductase (luciferase family)